LNGQSILDSNSFDINTTHLFQNSSFSQTTGSKSNQAATQSTLEKNAGNTSSVGSYQ
jgi:hypothetical protein